MANRTQVQAALKIKRSSLRWERSYTRRQRLLQDMRPLQYICALQYIYIYCHHRHRHYCRLRQRGNPPVVWAWTPSKTTSITRYRPLSVTAFEYLNRNKKINVNCHIYTWLWAAFDWIIIKIISFQFATKRVDALLHNDHSNLWFEENQEFFSSSTAL